VRGLAVQALALLGVFAAVTGVALLLGAENLGEAATFGQIAFVAGVAYVIVRRR
jgi:hypothetical protein